MFLFGHLRDFFRNMFKKTAKKVCLHRIVDYKWSSVGENPSSPKCLFLAAGLCASTHEL